MKSVLSNFQGTTKNFNFYALLSKKQLFVINENPKCNHNINPFGHNCDIFGVDFDRDDLIAYRAIKTNFLFNYL